MARWLLALTTLLLPLPLRAEPPPPAGPGGEGTSSSFESMLGDGTARLEAGDLEGAEAAFEEAARRRPERPEGWYLLAVVAKGRGDLATSLERVDQAISLRPDFRAALLLRGVVRFARRRYREALEDLERVSALPGPEGRITDLNLARRKYQALLREGKTDLPFEEAVRRGVLPVDVEAILSRRYARLCLLFSGGPGFRRPYAYATEHYEVVAEGSEGTARMVGDHLEAARTAFRKDFPPPVGETRGGLKLPVLIFADRAHYVRFLTRAVGDPVAARIAGGAYHPLTRHLLLVVDPDLDGFLRTLRHEAFHQYMDLHHPRLPPWLSEGLADYFGASRLADTGLVPGQVHPKRRDALEAALSRAGLPDLPDLLRADPSAFAVTHDPLLERRRRRVSRNYALAWGFVHFLMEGEDGALRGVITGLLDRLRRGASIEAAMAAHLPAEAVPVLAKRFVAYARRRFPPGD